MVDMTIYNPQGVVIVVVVVEGTTEKVLVILRMILYIEAHKIRQELKTNKYFL